MVSIDPPAFTANAEIVSKASANFEQPIVLFLPCYQTIGAIHWPHMLLVRHRLTATGFSKTSLLPLMHRELIYRLVNNSLRSPLTKIVTAFGFLDPSMNTHLSVSTFLLSRSYEPKSFE
jgi:hypothetical protein